MYNGISKLIKFLREGLIACMKGILSVADCRTSYPTIGPSNKYRTSESA